MLYTLVVLILVLMLLGALPGWGWSRDWGPYPAGGLGFVVVVILVLLLLRVI
jgi:hypothetical protein